VKYYEDTFSAKQPFTRWLSHDGYSEGKTFTQFGIVSVFVWHDKEHYRAFTRFDFISGGHVHTRTYEKAFTKRGAATIAHKFAKEKFQ